jgi:hypothetical protein
MQDIPKQLEVTERTVECLASLSDVHSAAVLKTSDVRDALSVFVCLHMLTQACEIDSKYLEASLFFAQCIVLNTHKQLAVCAALSDLSSNPKRYLTTSVTAEHGEALFDMVSLCSAIERCLASAHNNTLGLKNILKWCPLLVDDNGRELFTAVPVKHGDAAKTAEAILRMSTDTASTGRFIYLHNEDNACVAGVQSGVGVFLYSISNGATKHQKLTCGLTPEVAMRHILSLLIQQLDCTILKTAVPTSAVDHFLRSCTQSLYDMASCLPSDAFSQAGATL